MALPGKVFATVLSLFGNVQCHQQKPSVISESCHGLSNGLHYIRPAVSSGSDIPPVIARCHNDWTILDYSLDSNINHYFSSFSAVTDDFGSMDVGIEHINWADWLQINDIQLTISEDCNTCSDYEGIDTAYYMTGNYYGCSFATKSLCDMNPTTLQCNQCIMSNLGGNVEYPGLCTHIVLPTDSEDINSATTSHQTCVTAKWNYLPSIGLNGQFCPCFKPINPPDLQSDAQFDRETNLSPKSELDPLPLDILSEINDISNEDSNDNMDDPEEDINCDQNVVILTNDDFKDGTYRIRQCGTYILDDDIELNMNSEDDWWPTEDQQADRNLYPSTNFIGAFSMGFFAGISIEHNDVTIDLNEHTLSMAHDFYVQQRFFSLIELGSKPFISGQGPANFGSLDVEYPDNVIIRNGILGLSSHHGIHGNHNGNVYIHNVQIRHFEVSGISMNGFDDLLIENVVIGPNYQNVPVTPQYAHGRFMMQRLERIPDKEEQFVVINGRKVNAQHIMDRLTDEMEAAFTFSQSVQNGINGMESMEAMDFEQRFDDNLYINRDGLPHGGTLYGILLNSEGASVFGLGLSPGYSSNAVLRNVEVRELRAKPEETV